MLPRLALLALLCLPLSAMADDKAPAKDLTTAARDMTTQALNFRQGDKAGLFRSEQLFTPRGWEDFLRGMNTRIDRDGTPWITSAFKIVDSEFLGWSGDGTIRVGICGKVTHSKRGPNLPKRSYDNVIEVILTEAPVRIKKMSQQLILAEDGKTGSCAKLNKLRLYVPLTFSDTATSLDAAYVAAPELATVEHLDRLEKVLAFYGIPYRRQKKDVLLIDGALDKDTLWNLTTKADDPYWMPVLPAPASGTDKGGEQPTQP